MNLLPQPGIPLTQQIQNHETGRSWHDFIDEMVVQQMGEIVILNNAAARVGHVMSAGTREDMELEIESMRMFSASHRSFDAYLQAMFGRSMNERTLYRLLDLIFTAGDFREYMQGTFSYSAEELNAFYEENRDALDNFTYRTFPVMADLPDFFEFDTPEAYEAARDEAFAVARNRAAGLVAAMNSQEDVIAAARDTDEELFLAPASTLNTWPGEFLTGLDYGGWLLDPARRYGDVTTVDFDNGTHVVFFVNRDDNNYNMVHMRQILIMRENVRIDGFDSEDDPLFQELIAQVERDASARAHEVFDLFVAGGRTEELLLELMDEHSDDPAPGGLYENISRVVTQNKLVAEIEDWLFAPDRQAGDSELIRTEDFGYHLVFVTGFGENYRDFVSETRARQRDMNDWLRTLGIYMVDGQVEHVAIYSVHRHWAFRFTQN